MSLTSVVGVLLPEESATHTPTRCLYADPESQRFAYIRRKNPAQILELSRIRLIQSDVVAPQHSYSGAGGPQSLSTAASVVTSSARVSVTFAAHLVNVTRSAATSLTMR